MKKLRPLMCNLSRIALGGIFLYAGVVKALDVVSFARSVSNYQILPYALNYLVAAILPYVEILAGLSLVLGRFVRSATLLIGGLNIVFIGALVSVLIRGLDIDCGCFDPTGESHTTAEMALIRDMGILVLVWGTWYCSPKAD